VLLLLLFFEVIKQVLTLEMHTDKPITVDESNNAAKPPDTGDQCGFEGEAPDAVAILQLFSKNTHL